MQSNLISLTKYFQRFSLGKGNSITLNKYAMYTQILSETTVSNDAGLYNYYQFSKYNLL